MIVVVGEALVDLVIEPDGGVTAALGGAPFNTARACGRLGAEVDFVGAISVDRFGSLLADRLHADGVAIDLAPRVDVPTTLAAAELDAGGAATYRFYLDGTSAPQLADGSLPPGAAMLFTGGLALVLEPMAATVEAMVTGAAHDCAVMVDVNCRPRVVADRSAYVARVERVLAGADVVKVSDDDLAYLVAGRPPIDAARGLLDLGPRAVLLTAGAAGVHVLTRRGERTIPVPAVEVVDTIGAGDTFGGGFLTWWTESGGELEALGDPDRLVPAVEAAAAVAGIVCTRRGADPPWRRELAPNWAPTEPGAAVRPWPDGGGR